MTSAHTIVKGAAAVLIRSVSLPLPWFVAPYLARTLLIRIAILRRFAYAGGFYDVPRDATIQKFAELRAWVAATRGRHRE